MRSVESNGCGEGRKIISIGTFRVLDITRKPEAIEALARMPRSTQEVLTRLRPPININRNSNPPDSDPLPPAA